MMLSEASVLAPTRLCAPWRSLCNEDSVFLAFILKQDLSNWKVKTNLHEQLETLTYHSDNFRDQIIIHHSDLVSRSTTQLGFIIF
jgi:hypothetical protein